ncbi:SymE family type I addiction module toxin, partial [Salmonella enterica]|uniref:SymE family type I addiction module toxin n=1 Tax=Salmonella enterica TaxID=28901 RepID=UPI001D0CD078
VRHINSETCMTACYSQIPSQHLKGDWQEEAGFETGHGVTVKILCTGVWLVRQSGSNRAERGMEPISFSAESYYR